MAPDQLRLPNCPLSLLPPATSWLHTHCLHHTVLRLSYLQPHPGNLHTASAIQSSVSPTCSHILALYTLPPPYSHLSLLPDTLRPPYGPLSLLPTATSRLLIHCHRHTVLYLFYLQPHPGSLHTASTIQSSVSTTSSHILALYTLPPPHCFPYLQPHPGSLNTASATLWLLIRCVHHTILSSVSPTFSHILAPVHKCILTR